ncbi:hypothetical protein Fmac_010631 [Flemingia macrophylla]|uniref:Uncharacterized protein n=1 Tax=Flemingia macrophylla TaxID=520843 RepID=A0ABD1MM97_9FABA
MAGVAEEHKMQPYGVSVPPKRKRERVSEASMKRRKLMLDLNEPPFPDLNKTPPPDTSSDDDDDQASSVAENEIPWIAAASGNIDEGGSSSKKGYWKRFREWILSKIKKDVEVPSN